MQWLHRCRRYLERTVVAGAVAIALCPLAAPPARAYDPGDSPETEIDLTSLSIEQLMDIEVTSVSKKEESWLQAPAAIYVITQEDIRRSGVTSIPEALRMAPGLQVAQIDSNKWAVSARGFNGIFANKLLVLIDGRTVYTPLFAGVYWNLQDTMIEDIERIEVIRGPGATLWGSNAVNGVINIITKKAEDTQGGLVTGGFGTEERGFGGVRYGGKLGDDSHYRVYAKYFSRDDSAKPSGGDAADDWDSFRAGFRADWEISDSDSITLQGDIYQGDAAQTTFIISPGPPFMVEVDDTVDVAGGNILARYTHIFSDTSDLHLQLYYDRTERDEEVFSENLDIFDIEMRHRFRLSERHEIIWGLGYRKIIYDTVGTFGLSFGEERHKEHIAGAFIQDEITLVEDRLQLTVGSKFEHDAHSGSRIQPNARILFTPSDRQTVWAAVSHADRAPSRFNHGAILNFASFPPGVVLRLLGSDDFGPEELTAFELGYRARPSDRIWLDMATFYNVYHNLQTNEPIDPFLEVDPSPLHIVIPTEFDNLMDGETYGLEIAVNYSVNEHWKLAASYTYLQIQLHPDDSSMATDPELEEGTSPHNQFQIHSYLDISDDFEFDAALYYVDSLTAIDVDSYIRLDLRLGWHPSEDLEVSIAMQNLLDKRHTEFTDLSLVGAEVERSIYGKITWRF